MAEASIEPAAIRVAERDLDDLRARLSRMRSPEPATAEDWARGPPLASLRALCDHWLNRYDWRRCEAMLYGWNPHLTTIDGLGIQVFHIRSPEPHALPVVMTHGRPGAVVKFHKVISPLTDPRAHGGDPADALHLVLPQLPATASPTSHPRRDGTWSEPATAESAAVQLRRDIVK